ncbi:MAG: hypothetical protein U5L09_21325 [Bacteroidales bacterium]|nr:hypothetical protein [Bacteroidales bacterium]
MKKLASQHNNITIVENPDNDAMSRLIREAQVHVLVTFQATGLKLKLLNTLFNGRHILVNPKMVAGTMAENLCVTANDEFELQRKVMQLMETPFDEHTLSERKRLLEKYYSNNNNATTFIKTVFGK